VPYPRPLVDALVAELALDGSGRLLDVGCGPGSLTLLLAPWFEHATALDADAEMLAEGARQAAAAGIGNVDWLNLRAEDLPLDTAAGGPFRAVTLAQSFHWMDRALVAGRLRKVLARDGALVHVHATTHRGLDGDLPLPYPRPPRAEIDALVTRFLGPGRRAGQRTLPPVPINNEPVRGRVEAGIYRAAGFVGPTRIEIAGSVVERSADEVLASVFSLSGAAPHLFGHRVGDFEAALRELLADAGPDGRFSEQLREIAVDVWRI
jgi:SAM-dependent methyltransferase